MAKRPNVLTSRTVKTQVGCGKMYIIIAEHENINPFEISAQLGKSGQCGRVSANVICEYASLALQAGCDPKKLMKKAMGQTCEKWNGSPTQCRSCSDAIGRAIGFSLGLFEEDLITPVREKK